MPQFYKSNLDFPGLADGLKAKGMNNDEIAKIMGGNWLKFYDRNFLETDNEKNM